MLTGKAKLHFDVWAKQHPDISYNTYTGVLKVGAAYFSELPDCMQQIVILEWLDSVEIYVSIIPVVRATGYYYFCEVTYRRFWKINVWSSPRIETRLLAMETGIKKALDIYNGKTT